MIQEGETVAVGVSGGKDSLVTLTALARLSKFYQKPFKVWPSRSKRVCRA